MTDKPNGLMTATIFNVVHALKDVVVVPSLATLVGTLAVPAFGVIAAVGTYKFGKEAMGGGSLVQRATLGVTAIAAALTAVNAFAPGIVPAIGVPLAVVGLLLPSVLKWTGLAK